jgi:hypothetical protein
LEDARSSQRWRVYLSLGHLDQAEELARKMVAMEANSWSGHQLVAWVESVANAGGRGRLGVLREARRWQSETFAPARRDENRVPAGPRRVEFQQSVEDTRRYMRVPHEQVIERLKWIQEG